MELRFDQNMVMLLHKYNYDKETMFIHCGDATLVDFNNNYNEVVNGCLMEKESCRTEIQSDLDHNLNTKQLIHLQDIAKMKNQQLCS